MLALCLPAAVLIGFTVRPLAAAFFGFESARLDLLTVCTWAFLIGLVGDTWLEVAVRSHYANLNTRTPLIAAALQVSAFVLLASILPRWIGLPEFHWQLRSPSRRRPWAFSPLLNRRFPGLLDVANTAARAFAGAVAAGVAAFLAIQLLPASAVLTAVVALAAGALVATPFIWREVRLLMNL
jgi:peptidoglycan biosynthesis protein MviN/MurJ (putative lipid II flippase)